MVTEAQTYILYTVDVAYCPTPDDISRVGYFGYFVLALANIG